MTASSCGIQLETTICVLCAPGFEQGARTLSEELGFCFLGAREELKSEVEPLVLWLDDSGLSLRQTGKKAPGPVQADFVGGAARHRRLYGGGKSQSIAKAVGVQSGRRPSVADLTAGLGGDGFVLASLGCRVTLVERHPVIWALLNDALERARRAVETSPELTPLVARMHVVNDSAFHWLETPGDATPDVIYLDPMFPERQKTAQVNKAMQAFQQLVGDDADADDLLPLALEKATYRVVVKRPSRAPWLNNQSPGYSLEGKSIRYDIYPLKKMT